MHARDCCGPEAPPLIFTKIHNSVVWDSSYLFCVAGGTPPYSWSAEGAGLDIGGGGECQQLKVGNCFCEPGLIRVTDSCDVSIAHGVTSENGEWESIPLDELPSSYKGVEAQETEGSISRYQDIHYKVEQWWNSNYNMSGTFHFSHCSNGFDSVPENCEDEQTKFLYNCFSNDIGDDIYVYPIGKTVVLNDGILCNFSDFEAYLTIGAKGTLWYLRAFSTQAWKWVCEDLVELEYDEENSVEIIADDSQGTVFVIGGRYPYIWKVTGQGFFLDETHTLTEAQTNEPYITIYTLDACGVGSIECIDKCEDVVEGSFKSTEGEWTFVSYNECPQKGVEATEVIPGTIPSVAYYMSNSMRIRQEYSLFTRNNGTYAKYDFPPCSADACWQDIHYNYITTDNWDTYGCVSYSVNLFGIYPGCEDDYGYAMFLYEGDGHCHYTTVQKYHSDTWVEEWKC